MKALLVAGITLYLAVCTLIITIRLVKRLFRFLERITSPSIRAARALEKQTKRLRKEFLPRMQEPAPVMPKQLVWELQTILTDEKVPAPRWHYEDIQDCKHEWEESWVVNGYGQRLGADRHCVKCNRPDTRGSWQRTS